MAVLAAAGIEIEEISNHVIAAFHHLFERRATACGLLQIIHPWENGTDDSPRWERWQTQPFDQRQWWAMKGKLVEALELEGREAVRSEAFAVCPAGWNALVAWNAAEAAAVTGDRVLAAAAQELTTAIDQLSWNEALNTWIDVDPKGRMTSTIRTVDGLLGVLVTGYPDRADRILAALAEPDEYGTPFGPPGVHPAEPTFDPKAYWRGGAWPPWNYLLRTAADRRGHKEHAAAFDSALINGACASGFSEYWDPITGAGQGARPQSWSCLAAVPRELASPASLVSRRT
jgi:hypothetical protein